VGGRAAAQAADKTCRHQQAMGQRAQAAGADWVLHQPQG